MYLVLISYGESYTILRMYTMLTTTNKFFSQKYAERLHKEFSYCVLNFARAYRPPHGNARDAGQVCRWNTLNS